MTRFHETCGEMTRFHETCGEMTRFDERAETAKPAAG
jgi:hypothetical protein